MIHDPGTNDLIRWSDTHDDAVYIHDASSFSQLVLPHYFSHSNWPSFVRQLNIYGFRRVKDDPRGAESYQFLHEDFKRNGEQHLHHIKRKGHSMPGGPAIAINPMERLDRLLQQLEALEFDCAAAVTEAQTLHNVQAQQQQVLVSMLDLFQDFNLHPELAEVQRRLQSALEIANSRMANIHPLATGVAATPVPLRQQLPSIAEAVRTAKETTDLPPLHDSTHR